MSKKVKLDDIIDGIQMSSFEQSIFIHTPTSTVVHIMQDFLNDAEEEEPYDDAPEWQQEEMELANYIIENPNEYISTTTQFDGNDYRIMETFCYTQTGNIRTQLLHAIDGKGAFRRFKDKVRYLGIEDAWYTFQDEGYQQIAINFCEYHGLKYE